MTWRAVVRWRFVLQVGWDSMAWLVAIVAATLLRYEFSWNRTTPADFLKLWALATVLQLLIGSAFGLYVHRWRYGVFEEIGGVCRTVASTGAALVLLNRFAFGHDIPVSATVMAPVFALLVMCGGRFAWRMVLERSMRPSREHAEPVIVFGAGEGGTQVIRAMLSDKNGRYYPVALLDDDPRYRNLSIKGVRVRGARSSLNAVAASTCAAKLLIAIPSATGELLRDLASIASEAGLEVLVLPPVSELFGSDVGLGDIRPLTEEDLIGRRILDTDVDAVASYLEGKRILVTGAGGSIGSELCRQIHAWNPAQLVMLDRDETGLQHVQLSIEGQGLLDRDELVVADIRDRRRLHEVFERFRPEVVFHAAALKHLTLLERNPDEGWKTNVVGSYNVLSVASEFGVGVFVNISTDKAADPSSVLGRTKRAAEQLTAHAALSSPGTFLSVRFGNVLGSRGSMLPLFRAQIAAGGPVTVTHPDVSRYFMTIPEACELVIQGGAQGESGQVLVLNMGSPVRIADVATRLIAESGAEVEIVYTGLRQGEKLHEALFGDDERPRPSGHPLISCVDARPVSAEALGIVPSTPVGKVIDLRSGSPDRTIAAS